MYRKHPLSCLINEGLLDLREHWMFWWDLSFLEVILQSSVMRDVTKLNISCRSLGNRGAKALATQRSLSNLLTLNVADNSIGDEGATLLLASPNLSNLIAMDLSFNQFSGEGLEALVNAKSLRNLTTLNLSNNRLGSEGVKALVKTELVRKLTTLNLGNNRIGSEGVKALADSESLCNLTTLDLSQNNISQRLKKLLDSEGLSNLTIHRLKNSYINDEGIKGLVNSQYLRNLTTLKLANIDITIEGLSALANSEFLPKLTTLEIANNNIGKEGVIELTNSVNISKLTTLDLSNNILGDEGTEELVSSATLSKLTALNLSDNALGDKGAKKLANSEALSNLASLTLNNNNISKEGVKALINSTTLSNLRHLTLRGNPVVDIPERLLDDISALRTFFRLKETEQEKPLTILKAFIIGQPGVGKTTLFRALSQQPLDLGKLPRTHGADRMSIMIRVKSDLQPEVDVKLNVVDFGGQRLQMMVHSLFISEKAVYFLVLNQDSTSDNIRFWLNCIKSVIKERGDVRILPIRNPSLNQNARPLPTELLNLLVPKASEQFRVANEVTLDVQPPSLQMSNGGDTVASTDNIIQTLSYELATFPFKTGFEVHIRIAEYIRENLESLFPEPFYHTNAFNQIIKRDKVIDGLLKGSMERASIDKKLLGQFRKDVTIYLDYMGVLTKLDLSEVGSGQKDSGYIIVAPDLVQRGLYCVFPPEDELREHNSGLTTFYNRLVNPRGNGDIIGCFTKDDFSMLVKETFKESVELHGDVKEFTQELLEILCHRKLGQIIPLSGDCYMVPAYIEEAFPYDSDIQTEQIIGSWQRAQNVYVIELENLDGVIHFPSYFLYKLMVHCREDNQNVGIQYSRYAVLTDVNSIRTQRCLMRWERSTSIYVELVMYEGKIWCFGFSEDSEVSNHVEGLISAVYEGLRRFFYYDSRSTTIDISRSIPCPECMSNLTKKTELTQLNTKASIQYLDQVHLFSNRKLMEKVQSNPTEVLQCDADSLHRFYPYEIKSDLTRLHKSGQSSEVQTEQITTNELLGYVAIIYEFLHDNGLGMLKEDGSSNVALPCLFPAGDLGPTEKTMAKMVRWYYQHNGETKPPGDKFVKKSIEHLLNRIPIFRVWASIKTESQNVSLHQYYPSIKAVAEGLQHSPKRYLSVWSLMFPKVNKRHVNKSLRDKL